MSFPRFLFQLTGATQMNASHCMLHNMTRMRCSEKWIEAGKAAYASFVFGFFV